MRAVLFKGALSVGRDIKEREMINRKKQRAKRIFVAVLACIMILAMIVPLVLSAVL